MDAIVLNRQFEVVGVLDRFSSFIWTERYCGYGDFEIETEITDDYLQMLKIGNYVSLKGRKILMFIESVSQNFTEQNGAILTVSGKSLDALFMRKVIPTSTTFAKGSNFQNGIKSLINNNVINPSDTKRKFSDFVFQDSTNSAITSLTFAEEVTYYGDNLYDTIRVNCEEKDVGFMVEFRDDNKFVFKLYFGKDRTYDQTENIPIVFSPEFGNLISSRYYETYEKYKNVAYVVGEFGDDNHEVKVEVGNLTATGLDRFETFVDAKRANQDDELTETEYTSQLKSEGNKALEEVKRVNTLDAEVEYNSQFKYGEDYDVGDILEVVDQSGNSTKVRITEIVLAEDVAGVHVNPSFVVIDS